MIDKQKIILFDGVCNFCNFWVNFILDRDKKDLFKFAALQSKLGNEILKKFNMDNSNLESVILLDGESVYSKSTAALKIAKELSGPVKILYPLLILPKFLRDFFYDLIAKNRYKIFGKKEVCRIPTEEEKVKFLD